MVAFAVNNRLSPQHGITGPSPAVVVMRYKHVTGTGDRPEMPHGVTLQQMLTAVVKAEQRSNSLADDLARFASD
jgi:hypothetical protein